MKITYYLGAGASFNAIPIWKEQGESMIYIADMVLKRLSENELKNNPELSEFANLFENPRLKNVFFKLKEFGKKAVEFGSIDIYAKRLDILEERSELSSLKYSLSVYFDIWESQFYRIARGLKINSSIDNTEFYQHLDKRYFSLFSILLKKADNLPKLNDNIKFITWNYDLQLENTYKSFLRNGNISLENLDNNIRFLEYSHVEKPRDIIHLNGHRGMFKVGNDLFETAEQKHKKSLLSYLKRLLSNQNFEKGGQSLDYSSFIKYGWESSAAHLEDAKEIMKKTNVLVIIGYSFPAFNRKIDLELIREFELNTLNKKRVIYQDPYASEDLVKALFSNSDIVEFKKDANSQFHIPNEFLT